MQPDRRSILTLGIGLAVPVAHAARASAETEIVVMALAEAERMRRQAVAAGDQSYGAVVAGAGGIVGWGPSRVVVDRNPEAHAERVAIWDAQARLGRSDLSGLVLYSTSHPCAACEAAAARAGIERMVHGARGIDAGRPGGR